MSIPYQARWISKQRSEMLKRSGKLAGALLLDSFNGFLLVEPVGSNLGDGEILDLQTADYELSPVWCLSPPAKIRQARQLLGLEAPAIKEHLVGAA